jgi:F-type H+-transporting ATPase subunit b
MKALRLLVDRLFVLVAGLLLAIPVFAAEESGNAAEQSLGMGFKWFHFIVIAVLAYWVFAKALPPFFRRKADYISSAIEKATAAKADAERRLQEALAKLGNLEREVAAFREQAQRDALAEIERLRKATQLDVEKIRAAAQAEMAAAERAARVELKELAANLAVDGAESLVAKQMTPAVQEAMINSFVQSLQGRPN